MTETLDPLATSDLITTTYRRYLRSLLPIRDTAIAAALDEQITGSQLLAKGPFLEATPPYETGASLRDLIDEGVLSPGMRAIAGSALPPDRPLYRHQDQAIRKAVAGRNLVVATGTGSGKTESFLLPILNSLAVEQDNGTLTPGVRALLLYPMNALANDQMKRLRKLLAGTEFTFGRYTGDTRETYREAKDSFESLNPGDQHVENELLSREEMRATPPHLLLTNYAMLEYLLLRPIDLDLFEGAHSGRWKFITVDEAHVYDGAKAAEMAMLLRRLHDRVAPDRRLQCLVTSATIGDDPSAATKFAAQLLASPFEWVDGDPARQDLVGPTRRSVPAGPLWGPLHGTDYRKLAELDDPAAEIQRLAAARGGETGRTADWLLAREHRMSGLRSVLAGGPMPFADLARVVFDPDDDPEHSLAALVDVGSKIADESGTPVLSARYHLFTRATEGAYTCLTVEGPHVSLGRHQVCEDCSGAAFEIGACQRCGAVYLTGSLDTSSGKPVLVPQKREERSTWVLLDDSAAVVDEDEEILDDASSALDLIPATLCTACGGLNPGVAPSCCPGAVVRPVQVVSSQGKAVRNLGKCMGCGARGSSVRRFESGQDAAVAVVSTALYQALPADKEHAAKPGGGRKLLLFSDSRQRAAFFAPYLNNSYGQMQHRRLIWEGLRTVARHGDVRVDDLVDAVIKAATAVGVFRFRDLGPTKKKTTGLWIMRELLALDDRQSLEGRGLLNVKLLRDPSWQLTPALRKVGLNEDETWDLLSELTRTLRQQGVVTMPENVPADDEAFAPRKGPIFVRKEGSDSRSKVLSWLPTKGRNRRLDYMQRVLDAAGLAFGPREVLAECWDAILAFEEGWLAERRPAGAGVVRQVDHELIALEVGGASFQCSTCRRLAPVSVRGVCPTLGCQGKLTPWTVPDEESDTDHYRLLYRSMLPIPLVAKEHTAQWTGEEAAKIQQQFVRGDVNALSCSTTFELGVDVGELQSVVLRNMPPNTANYVQRAGRAGRRTASAALVVTYAQRAAHDLSRYQNPIDMIAGTVRAPYVPLGNERIDRRHAHSIALAAFFRYGKIHLGAEWKTAGQFLLPGEDGSAAPATLVAPFLSPVPQAIRESLSRVIPPSVQRELGVVDGNWAVRLTELLEQVRSQFGDEIRLLDERRQWAYENQKGRMGDFFGRVAKTIRDRNLIGYLASRNVLPKYGFPVDTVDLMTAHTREEVGERLELSRDLTSAIYEYAPGAQIVAGGKLWTSAGVNRRPGHELTGREFILCKHCGGIQVSNEKLEVTCTHCGQPYASNDLHGRYVIPEFGFLAARDPVDPGMTPPRRSWNGDTHVLELAAEPEEHEWRTEVGAGLTARAGARGRLLALSNGPTGRGFLICPACGWGQANVGKPDAKHKEPLRGTDCNARLQPRFLAHGYETDLLELSFPSAVLPSTDDSTLQSLLAAILEGASDRLQIARDDIGGTLYAGRNGRRTLVVYDTVPAGAGNALRIARSLDNVLAGALERVETCDCGAETSCYGCLRNYRNQWIHDLLRRDKALEVLHRIGVVKHAEQSTAVILNGRRDLPRLDGGTILVDTYTGETKAMVLTDGRILMHGEVYADAQQAADAADHNVDALDFWAAVLPQGQQPLRVLAR
jgi:DEAD/DEAH box helicase/Domain of unknown function (DUF1998)/Helicase conserved C-terminal domain